MARLGAVDVVCPVPDRRDLPCPAYMRKLNVKKETYITITHTTRHEGNAELVPPTYADPAGQEVHQAYRTGHQHQVHLGLWRSAIQGAEAMKNVLQDECRVYTEKDFLMWKTWMWVQGILTGAGVVVVGILTGAW